MTSAQELNDSIIREMQIEGYSQEEILLVAEYLANPKFDRLSMPKKMAVAKRFID